MKDIRLDKLANLLVNYSCELKKGEKVLIEATGIEPALVLALIDEVYKVGAYPFIETFNSQITRGLLINMTKELAQSMAKYSICRMQEMDAYIGIRGGNNSFELSDIDGDLMQIYDKFYRHPVHHDIRVGKTKWVILRYPTEGMSQLSKMSTAAFEEYYFNVCTLDYRKMDKAMDSLVSLMNKTDKVRLTAKNTDITFSIKDIGGVKCSGLRNIPDGEVYTAPVRNSINGIISYNTPSIENGIEFKDVVLEFKDGKIVKATANDSVAINKIFDTDEGARYVGEFAIGVNPYITKPMGDILFDEKISGSIHFTPGSCYEDANNHNLSSIHWDLVLIQTEQYGGGEIYFDDVLIRKNGIFVLDSLKCLNSEELK